MLFVLTITTVVNCNCNFSLYKKFFIVPKEVKEGGGNVLDFGEFQRYFINYQGGGRRLNLLYFFKFCGWGIPPSGASKHFYLGRGGEI